MPLFYLLIILIFCNIFKHLYLITVYILLLVIMQQCFRFHYLMIIIVIRHSFKNLKSSIKTYCLKKYLFTLNEAYIVYISKKWTILSKKYFLKKVFFCTSQLSCLTKPLASLEKKRNPFYNNQNCILYSTRHC